MGGRAGGANTPSSSPAPRILVRGWLKVGVRLMPLCKSRTGPVQVPCRPCGGPVQAPCRPCAGPVQAPCRLRAGPMEALCRPRASAVQAPSRPVQAFTFGVIHIHFHVFSNVRKKPPPLCYSEVGVLPYVCKHKIFSVNLGEAAVQEGGGGVGQTKTNTHPSTTNPTERET